MQTKRRLLQTCFAAATGLALPALAQEAVAPRPAPRWPLRPVRLLVGFPGASAPDLAARAIARPLGQLLGQPVLVDNRPGADGHRAAAELAAARDGHTLGVLIDGSLTVARLLDPRLPFDPEKDFTPLGLIGTAPLALVVSGRAPGRRPDELLLWARNLGPEARYGTPGVGSAGHLGMELLKTRISLLAGHQPLAGHPQVIEAMRSDAVQLALLPPGLALPHVRSGQLKLVGISSPERSPLTGDWPTLREAEVRGADLEVWTALAAPASLPPPVASELDHALALLLRSEPLRQTLLDAGWQAHAGGADELARRMRSDTQTLGGVIMMHGIRTGG